MNVHTQAAHVASGMLISAIQKSWTTLWTTRIGPLPLRVVQLDAQVVGKIFQELMIYELHSRDSRWRAPDAPRHPRDKDFVFTPDASQSFELKMCGQSGSRAVFGNRCSAPPHVSLHPEAKSRDGWLLTINYTGERLNLVRFGHVLGTDWIGQRAASGNSSRLHADVYASKLAVVRGDYQRDADPLILRKIGRKLQREGVGSVGLAADLGHREALDFLAASYYY